MTTSFFSSVKIKFEKFLAKLFWTGVIPETRANLSLKHALVFKYYLSRQGQKYFMDMLQAHAETDAAFKAAVEASRQTAARFGIPAPNIRIYAYRNFKHGYENGFYIRSYKGVIWLNLRAFFSETENYSVASTAAHETTHYWQHVSGKDFPEEMQEFQKELLIKEAKHKYGYTDEQVTREWYAIFIGKNWKSL